MTAIATSTTLPPPSNPANFQIRIGNSLTHNAEKIASITSKLLVGTIAGLTASLMSIALIKGTEGLVVGLGAGIGAAIGIARLDELDVTPATIGSGIGAVQGASATLLTAHLIGIDLTDAFVLPQLGGVALTVLIPGLAAGIISSFSVCFATSIEPLTSKIITTLGSQLTNRPQETPPV